MAPGRLFAKNGADVTTLAVTLSRAHTGRRTVLVANGAYHGSLPWCNPNTQGTVPGDRESLDYFDFNDLASVEAAIERHPDDLAGIIVSPYRQPPGADQEAPTREFAVGLRELCDRHGGLLIHDEVRTGMRFEFGTAWSEFGVAPDMSAWGKAIANGYALAALIGKEEVRGAASEVFATGSFWWTGDAMAAGLATLEVMEREDSLGQMREWGTRFQEGLAAAAAARGLGIVGDRTADDALRSLRGRRRRSRPELTSSRPRVGSTASISTPGTTGSSRRPWMSVILTRR